MLNLEALLLILELQGTAGKASLSSFKDHAPATVCSKGGVGLLPGSYLNYKAWQ